MFVCYSCLLNLVISLNVLLMFLKVVCGVLKLCGLVRLLELIGFRLGSFSSVLKFL